MLDLNQAATALKDVALTLVVSRSRWSSSRPSCTWSSSDGASQVALPIMLLTPAVVGLLVLYVYPLL